MPRELMTRFGVTLPDKDSISILSSGCVDKVYVAKCLTGSSLQRTKMGNQTEIEAAVKDNDELIKTKVTLENKAQTYY